MGNCLLVLAELGEDSAEVQVSRGELVGFLVRLLEPKRQLQMLEGDSGLVNPESVKGLTFCSSRRSC